MKGDANRPVRWSSSSGPLCHACHFTTDRFAGKFIFIAHGKPLLFRSWWSTAFSETQEWSCRRWTQTVRQATSGCSRRFGFGGHKSPGRKDQGRPVSGRRSARDIFSVWPRRYQAWRSYLISDTFWTPLKSTTSKNRLEPHKRKKQKREHILNYDRKDLRDMGHCSFSRVLIGRHWRDWYSEFYQPILSRLSPEGPSAI